MSKVTVYHADGRWFIPSGLTVREVPYALVCDWQKQMEVEVKEVESHD